MEVAKLRAARKLWATLMRERMGAKDPQSLLCVVLGRMGLLVPELTIHRPLSHSLMSSLRTHCQTSGCESPLLLHQSDARSTPLCAFSFRFADGARPVQQVGERVEGRRGEAPALTG